MGWNDEVVKLEHLYERDTLMTVAGSFGSKN